MADVDEVPKIRCDNCGKTVEKDVYVSHSGRPFHKPRVWGSMKAEDGRITNGTYGTGKERLDFGDLCPDCACAAFDAAHAALKSRRGE